MKLLLASLFSLSFISVYADDFLYFDYNSFSDDGGVTVHRFFKVKIPDMKKNEGMMCSLMFDYISEGEKEESDSAYTIVVEKGKNESVLGVSYEDSNSEGDESSYATSQDIRSNFNDLFVSSSHGDGYVFNEVMAGSKELILKNIKYFADEEDPSQHEYPDGGIDQAYDLTNQSYSKVIEGEDDPNYKTILNVECEMESEIN